MCDFSPPLGDVAAVDPAPGSPVAGPIRLDFGDTQITASAAITVDSTSIVYTGYTNSSGNFMGAVRLLPAYNCTKFHFIFFTFFKNSSSTSLHLHFYLSLGVHFTHKQCHLLYNTYNGRMDWTTYM